MNFVQQTPSLQHIALVKIVAHMWNQRDILTQIARSFKPLPAYVLRKDAKEWKAVEDNVKSVISALPLLDPPCKQRLLNLVKPIGMEVIVWCQYHSGGRENYFTRKYLDTLLPQQLCWTMHGTVDYKKTAELIMKDEKLDVERRYEIACINCLEDDARELFQCMREERRQKYRSGGENYYSLEIQFLIRYFTSTLISDDVDQSSRLGLKIGALLDGLDNKLLFKSNLLKGSRAAGEYFFQKVSQRELEQVLEELESWIERRAGYPTCGLLYFWSQMNEEQQRSMFRKNTTAVLKSLLGWPMQSLFLETAKRGWQFIIYKYQCSEVLSAIINKIRGSFRDYDYAQLFWECWRLTPTEHQQHYLDYTNHVESLFDTKKEEFIKLILYEAPSWQILALCDGHEHISRMLMDDNVISYAALMECAETAALESSKGKDNREKRLRSEYVSRFVNSVIDKRLILIDLGYYGN